MNADWACRKCRAHIEIVCSRIGIERDLGPNRAIWQRDTETLPPIPFVAPFANPESPFGILRAHIFW